MEEIRDERQRTKENGGKEERERRKKGEEPSKEEENKKWEETRGKEIEVGNSVTRKGTREKKKKKVPVLTKMGL